MPSGDPTGGKPVEREHVEHWLRGYESAWRTAGTAALAELFAAKARYRPAPYERPVAGLDAIAELWEAERDTPDEVFSMTNDVVAVEGDVAVARIAVAYGDPVVQEYRDLWVIRFDDRGRCVEFEEWPFWPPGSPGVVAGHRSAARDA